MRPRLLAIELMLLALWSDVSVAQKVQTNPCVTNFLSYGEVLQCGPDSLFMFLILCGHSEIGFEQMKNVSVSPVGTSLLELREAARKFGVETEIRHYRPEDIDSLPLPAIGQFITGESSLTQFHFDVLYKVDPNWVYLLNGTTGSEFVIRRSKLPNFWTGFAMVQKRSLAALVRHYSLFIVAGILVVIDCTIIVIWFLRHGFSQAQTTLEEAA